MPEFFRGLRYISVALILTVIVFTKIPDQIFITKMGNLALGVFTLGICLSIFSYRFFCFNLCPVRALRSFKEPKDLEA